MGPSRRLVSMVVAIIALAGILAPAAPAAKKKPKQVPLTVSTGTGSATVSPPAAPPFNAEVSSIATCPGNTVAAGGGFFGSVVSSPTTALRLPWVTQSVRVGDNQWRTRALALFGNASTPQDLTTEVYCIPRRGTIAEVATTTTIGGGNADAVSLSAACPPGSRLLSGGFTGSQGTTPLFTAAPTESAPAGDTWSLRMSRSGAAGSPSSVTAHAYCYTAPKAKKKKKGKKASVAAKKKKRKTIQGPRPLSVITAVGTLAAPPFSTGAVTTTPCVGHLRSVSGGFSGAPYTTTSAAIFTESRLATGAWRVSAIEGGNPAPAIPLTAFNDCA
jgi:hypothetical protein